MKAIQLATIALVLGAVTNCAVYSQPPGYGNAPPPQPNYDNQGGYYDRGGYDDPRVPRAEVGFFYDELSPYGDWVMTAQYGWAWFPRDVQPYWRPYSDGRWVMSEYGWTWVSYEPYGWATYHYGRWDRDPRFGWIWIPGTIWGPAWVSWQSGGGYIGWAPLPPAVGFQVGIGIQLGGFNLSIGIRPDAYSFVPEHSFLEPRLSGYYYPTARNVTIINNTTNITNYTYIDNRVINQGIDTRRVEQVTGRRVQQMRVAESRQKARSEVAGSEVRIYRPEKQQLDKVRVGPRANAGLRADTPPAGQPKAERHDVPVYQVAPRAAHVPPADVQKIDQRAQKEKRALEQYQAQEKQKVEKLHQQDLANAKAQADRVQVEKRHQAEREELQQEQKNAQQQLDARLKAEREAALATPPPQNKTAAQQQQDKKKAAEQQKAKGKAKGQDKKPEPPPPAV